ncbi:MAG: NUDIX domain-containing protein [Pseudomonadota bacterium]
MTETKTLHIAVAVVLDEAGRMLLVRKRGTEAFMQPGGKIEPGEDARASLARELREELGVDAMRMDYVERMTAPAANEPGFRVEADVFLVELSGAPEIGAEIGASCWHSKEASGRVVAPLSEELLRRFAAR